MFVFWDDNNNTDEILLFLHIPKTGGTTLSTYIKKQYNYCKVIKWKPDFTEEEFKKIKLIWGHMPFGIHNQIPTKNYRYFTMIREPVERVISDFYYARRHPVFKEEFNKISLKDYVTEDRYNVYMLPYRATVNFQTRLLAGIEEDDLEKAKNNLNNNFSVIGITERFDDSIFALNKTFGWEFENSLKQNETPNRPQTKNISDEIIHIIKEKNSKDISLYEYANELLNKQIHQFK